MNKNITTKCALFLIIILTFISSTFALTILNVNMDTTDTSAIISWETDAASNATINYGLEATDSFDNQIINSTVTTSHKMILEGLTPETVYNIRITSDTDSGSESHTNIFQTQREFLIENVHAREIKINEALITWNTTSEGDSKVYYGTSTNNLNEINSSSELTTFHKILLPELQTETLYYFYVESNKEDRTVMNDNEGAYYSFITTEISSVPLEIYNSNTSKTQNVDLFGMTTPGSKVEIIHQRTNNALYNYRIGKYYAIANHTTGVFNLSVRLDETSNDLVYRVTDPQNNIRNKAYNVIVDTIPPPLYFQDIEIYTDLEVAGRDLRRRGFFRSHVPLIGSAGENSTVEYCVEEYNTSLTCTWTDVEIINVSTGSFNSSFSIREKGMHNFTIKAIDSVGNENAINYMIDFDPDRPEVTLDDVPDQSHFQLIKIKGTTKPGTLVKIHNIGLNDVTDLDDIEGVGTELTYSGGKTLAQLLLGDVIEERANAEGKFEARVPIGQTFNPDGSESNINNFIVEAIDDYGNVGTATFRTQYVPGSAQWRERGVTAIANTVYTDTLSEGDVTLTLMFYLSPISGSLLNEVDINSLRIALTTDTTEENDNSFLTGQPEDTQYLVVDNEILVVSKFSVKKFVGNVYDGLPEQSFKFDFKADINGEYIAGGPYNDPKSVFIRVPVSIEKPLKHEKWLTPEFINKSIKFLTKAIDKMESVLEIVDKVTIGTFALCTGYYIYGYFGPTSKDYYKHLYTICDRIACPRVPPDCGGLTQKDDKSYFVNYQDSEISYQYVDDQKRSELVNIGITPPPCFGSQGVVLTNIKKPSEFNTQVLGREYSKQESFSFDCVDIDKDTFDSGGFKAQPGFCFNDDPNDEEYDEVKCILDKNARDVNPFADIISSVRCGCVTGIRGNLQSYLKIMKGMKKCLQQIELGKAKGAYCKRLIAQFVCDFVQMALMHYLKGQNPEGHYDRGIGIFGTSEKAKEINENFNDRYGDFAQNAFGLDSGSLVNSLCIAAISGSWESLRDSFNFNTITPVAPVIGPILPESDIENYNPLSGDLTINYRVTMGILSGGQEVNYKLTIFCDRSFTGGEFCRQGIVDTRIIAQSTVNPDDSLSQTFVDHSQDRVWYNKAVLEVEYELGDDIKREKFTAPIIKKRGLIGYCEFNINAGFVCEVLSPGAIGGIAKVSNQYILSFPGGKLYHNNPVFLIFRLERDNQLTEPIYLDYTFEKPSLGEADGISFVLDPLSGKMDIKEFDKEFEDKYKMLDKYVYLNVLEDHGKKFIEENVIPEEVGKGIQGSSGDISNKVDQDGKLYVFNPGIQNLGIKLKFNDNTESNMIRIREDSVEIDLSKYRNIKEINVRDGILPTTDNKITVPIENEINEEIITITVSEPQESGINIDKGEFPPGPYTYKANIFKQVGDNSNSANNIQIVVPTQGQSHALQVSGLIFEHFGFTNENLNLKNNHKPEIAILGPLEGSLVCPTGFTAKFLAIDDLNSFADKPISYKIKDDDTGSEYGPFEVNQDIKIYDLNSLYIDLTPINGLSNLNENKKITITIFVKEKDIEGGTKQETGKKSVSLFIPRNSDNTDQEKINQLCGSPLKWGSLGIDPSADPGDPGITT
ncbi:fibronectin type III domain-containing protein [Nanoarchaeota archaeon]